MLMSRMPDAPRMPNMSSIKSKDTLVKPQILALVAAAKAAGPNNAADTENPTALQVNKPDSPLFSLCCTRNKDGSTAQSCGTGVLT